LLSLSVLSVFLYLKDGSQPALRGLQRDKILAATIAMSNFSMRLVIVGMVIRSEYILKEGSSSPLNFEAYRRDPDASWHQYLSCIRSSSQEEEGHLEVKVRLLPDSRVAIEHDHHVMFGSGTPFNIRKRRLQMEKDIVYEAPPQKKSNTPVAESLRHAGNSVFEALGFSEYLHCFILRCLRSYLLGML